MKDSKKTETHKLSTSKNTGLNEWYEIINKQYKSVPTKVLRQLSMGKICQSNACHQKHTAWIIIIFSIDQINLNSLMLSCHLRLSTHSTCVDS